VSVLFAVLIGCGRGHDGGDLRIGVKIVSFNDYIQPNLALANGELDANFYQHVPFMEEFNRDHGTHFVAVTKVFIAPLAIYAGRARSRAALPDQATIAIPNDPTNGGRALLLLESAGLLKVRAHPPGKPIDPPTVEDITDNPRHIRIRELESAQVARALPDVDFAVINTNYALPAGLNPAKDSLFRETSDSPYVNVLAVNAGRENDLTIHAVAEALNAPAVRQFILTKYQGALVPAF